MTALPNPFIDSTLAQVTAVETAAAPCLDPTVAAAEFPRGFDPRRFVEDIEEIPLFLRKPPLEANDIVSILGVLAGY